MVLLPHYVVVNYKLDKLDDTDDEFIPVGAFETYIRKPISHLQGDIVKLTISNIVLELIGDDIQLSKVVMVKCEDLTLQNHDADSLGSVLFQTVPTVKSDNTVLAPPVPEIPEVDAKEATPEVEARDEIPAKEAIPEVEARDEIPAADAYTNEAGEEVPAVEYSAAIPYSPAVPAVEYSAAIPYSPAVPAVEFSAAIPYSPAVPAIIHVPYSAAVPAVMGHTHHTAHVDPVCLYCKNPVGLHRLRFSFSDSRGVSYPDIFSFTATLRFESIQ